LFEFLPDIQVFAIIRYLLFLIDEIAFLSETLCEVLVLREVLFDYVVPNVLFLFAPVYLLADTVEHSFLACDVDAVLGDEFGEELERR
jgi:hypothetical protein